MAYVQFEPDECAFLIVQDGADIHDQSKTILVQEDWDWPGIAWAMGWEPCSCGRHGWHDCCPHMTAREMITGAGEFIRAHAGESFDALDEYFA